MLSLIFTVIFAIFIAYFAVQNRNLVDLRFGTYLISGVPIYLVVLGSILVSLLFAGIIVLVNTVFSTFTLLGRNNTIRRTASENEKLELKLQELEAENEKLKEHPMEPAQKKPFFFPVRRRFT